MNSTCKEGGALLYSNIWIKTTSLTQLCGQCAVMMLSLVPHPHTYINSIEFDVGEFFCHIDHPAKMASASITAICV